MRLLRYVYDICVVSHIHLLNIYKNDIHIPIIPVGIVWNKLYQATAAFYV